MTTKSNIKSEHFKTCSRLMATTTLMSGNGNPIIVLHGLMGGLGNFKEFLENFPNLNYQSYNARIAHI